MAKKIALTLTINGVKQQISNINQLEEAIKGAQDQLKGMEIGSEGFKKLSTDVRNAKSVLEDFEESVKGQELEKRVGAFAKVGEGITSSFAGAQAAIALFGSESEAVAEAAAKAQSVLTIALAARSAAEGLVAVRTVAANIATAASAAAANAATVATRTLYATLAANPYGAILAVIGAVVGALILLTNTSKEQVNVQKELATATSDEANSLKNSLTILTQFNGQRNLQRQEIEKLKKEYPGFNAFVDKENKLTAEGVKFIKLKIRQYELEAQAKLVTQKIAENGVKILEIEQKQLFDNISFWEELWIAIKSGGNPVLLMQERIKTASENMQADIKAITDENEQWRKSLSNIYIQTDEVLRELKIYEDQLQKQVVAEENAKKKTEEAKKTKEELANAYKKGRTEIVSFKDELNKLNEAFKKYDETIKGLESLAVSAKVVEDLEKVREARIAGAKEFQDAITSLKTSVRQLTEIPKDEFLGIFANFRTQLEQAFSKSGEDIGKFKKIYTNFVENNKDLNQEQIDALYQVYKGYEDFTMLITTTPGFKNAIDGLKGINAAWDDNITALEKGYGDWYGFLNILGDISAAAGDFRLEIDDATGAVKEFKFDPTAVSANAQETYKQIRQALIVPITKDLLKQKQLSLEALIPSLKGTDLAQAKGQLDKIKEVLKSDKIETTGLLDPQEIAQAVNGTIEQFNKLLSATVKAEQKVFAINKQVQALTASLSANTGALSASIANVLSQNIDTVFETLIGRGDTGFKEAKKYMDLAKSDVAGFEAFKNDLVKKGILDENQLRSLGYNDALKLFAAYKKKEVEINKKGEEDKKKDRQESFNDIIKGFELFSQTLNQVSALTQERVRTDLDSLKIAQKNALDQVVGDTEQAAAKRLEIQAEYEAKAKEIEKRGRIASLQFSLVQTIANGAQAVVKSLAELGPILGPIMAGVSAALSLAQVVIIQDQIANAQAMRRGGILKAQSGMLLQGPSHENGGIPLAQMGIVAEGNEAIINRQSSINFRELLSTVNQSGGGRPLVVNNFDDSRIVEALAKQKQTPIRAYVLGSDITKEQQISARLDSLSKF